LFATVGLLSLLAAASVFSALIADDPHARMIGEVQL
jgi:hypothetical protein